MIWFLLIELCMGAAPITDCASLQQMGLLDAYTLTKSIDCRGFDFKPIGSPTQPFAGSFDGNFHTISNLAISQLEVNNVGLFGSVVGGRISNLVISGAKVNGGMYAGVLAGTANTTSISNVSVSGNVICGVYGGGLVGVFSMGKLVNCSSSVVVISNGGAAGGLAGAIISSNLMRCNATGTVSAVCQDQNFNVGGLAGSINGSKDQASFVVESSSSGPVSANCNWVGGLFGSSDAHTTMENCYSTAAVKSSSDAIPSPGGMVGSANGAFLVFSYFGGSSICESTSICYGGGLFGCWIGLSGSTVFSYFDATKTASRCLQDQGHNSQDMMMQATYENWDFSDTWNILEKKTYPFLRPQ